MTDGLFSTFFAHSANLNEFSVSSACLIDGPMLTIIDVHELPPSESCNSHVSLASRNGVCFEPFSVNELMQLPSALSEKLMVLASSSHESDAPVFLTRSEPARSTRKSVDMVMQLKLLPHSFSIYSSDNFLLHSTFTISTACDLDECALSFVNAVDQCHSPTSNTCIAFSTDLIGTHNTPLTNTPELGFSHTLISRLSGSMRSYIISRYICMNDTLISYEYSSASSACLSNIYSMALGITPHSSGFLYLPTIVCVLPVPVWPYANMVPLNPSSTESTTGRAAPSYTYS